MLACVVTLVCNLLCVCVVAVSVAVRAGGMGVLGGYVIHLVSSACVDLRCILNVLDQHVVCVGVVSVAVLVARTASLLRR